MEGKKRDGKGGEGKKGMEEKEWKTYTIGNKTIAFVLERKE